MAELLSRRLGYPCLDREVIQEAAEQLGVSLEKLQGKFETAPGLWARITQEREKYLLAVQTALAEWCTRGDLIYHGIAGQFLLRDLPEVLRVLVVAPMEKRIEALKRSHSGMTTKQMVDFIQKVDSERGRWVQSMYGEDLLDPKNYDLTLNLQTMSTETACEVVAQVVAQARFEITADVEGDLFAFAAECRLRLKQALEG